MGKKVKRPEKKIRCNFCNKKDFTTPLMIRYIIWIKGEIKNNGEVVKDTNGNAKITRINPIFAKFDLYTEDDAKAYAKKYVIPTLKENQSIEYEEMKIPKFLKCPSCRRTDELWNKNRKIAEQKRNLEGLNKDPKKELELAFEDIKRKVAEDYRIKKEMERKELQESKDRV
jgi:hypothetical protein